MKFPWPVSSANSQQSSRQTLSVTPASWDGTSGTVARLRQNRSERLDPILAKYGGRLVKLSGDGALVEFASAVDALSAAIEFQQAMADLNRDEPADTVLAFRIGLHLGDLIVDGGDLYGDSVNVAARLEAEASAGGIVLSATARDFIGERVKAHFADLGDLSLKNIERRNRAFRVEWEEADWRPAAASVPSKATESAALEEAARAMSGPPRLSIVVLPFANIGGDPELEYFVDGVTESLTTDL